MYICTYIGLRSTGGAEAVSPDGKNHRSSADVNGVYRMFDGPCMLTRSDGR